MCPLPRPPAVLAGSIITKVTGLPPRSHRKSQHENWDPELLDVLTPRGPSAWTRERRDRDRGGGEVREEARKAQSEDSGCWEEAANNL